MLLRFENNSIFVNSVVAHPRIRFFLHSGSVFYNNRFSSSIAHVPGGHVSLYELNINRDASELIYPYTYKDGSGYSLGSVSTVDYDSANYGDTIVGSYPLSASMTRDYYPNGGGSRRQVNALKNILENYRIKSEHFSYSSSLGDKGTQDVTLIDIPGIIAGSGIKPGTVTMKFYVSGAVHGVLRDNAANGELRQESGYYGTNDGDVAGVCLYDHGLILLTGSWEFSPHTDDYEGLGATPAKWVHWGSSGSASPKILSSSYVLECSGTNTVNTMTAYLDVPRTLVHSSNPSFINFADKSKYRTFASGSQMFKEMEIRATDWHKTPYSGSSGSFVRRTAVSKVGIYDEEGALIAVSKLATPLIVGADRSSRTIKLKLDI